MTVTNRPGGGRRVKSVEQSIRDTDEPGTKLKKELGTLDLIVFGVAVVIGAGIFTLAASTAGNVAGPSVSISFVLAAVACALAALCYAEFASTVPVAGSAYTFSYATLGEFVAWIIGWDLVLEFAVGSAYVSTGWSEYLQQVLELAGLDIPTKFELGGFFTFNWGALILVVALATLLYRGTKLSSRVSLVITTIKVAIVLFVIILGLFYVRAANYTPFIPEPAPGTIESGGGIKQSLLSFFGGASGSVYGYYGLFAAAAVVFFAFIGFDAVATTAEETKNPSKALPRGILGSLAIVTVLYVAVALVLTGMVPYTDLATQPDGTKATLATAFSSLGVDWAAAIIAIGALLGLTTVVMVLMLGQIRVLFAMSRDGLLPTSLAKTGSRGTPGRATWLIGTVVALIATFFPAEDLEQMVNIGTLFAFVLVSIGVIILRRTRPELPRAFRTPLVPLVPILAVLACVWLMLSLSVETWLRFVIWMVLGVAVYVFYGRSHSLVGIRQRSGQGEAPPETAEQDTTSP
ncbi:amino acid/polyamine/organocation transporter (APC superfamily) [Pseudonocardia sediminis]|uniref:Amino acid/polyamine/organocation transporter (APC superfamily) n=1 Tax=Pseudonocardia sediminis TaxID=1397368 RepID=A0A4Q7V135_PSEST|nr:amino acid permease [Pseudonocardia sediminis]RZT88187.1 amino acid/polyamine/organocation transporter (APC superfamily) [Pseudonocardia sediminis]